MRCFAKPDNTISCFNCFLICQKLTGSCDVHKIVITISADAFLGAVAAFLLPHKVNYLCVHFRNINII